ncbi:MAG: Mth938-like domain-containing protein [Rhodospirillales bacterium]
MQSYGGLRFRIAGEVHEGSVLVFPKRTLAWAVAEAAQVTVETLEPVTAADERPAILVVGCGPTFQAPPAGLRSGLKAAGVALEWMDTGAACRTFNVLLAEERDCAAALIAVE